MVKKVGSPVQRAFDDWCGSRPFLSPKMRVAMYSVFSAGFQAGFSQKPICCVCGKEVTGLYVTRDLNNNCYCSTKCFAEKRRSERK